MSTEEEKARSGGGYTLIWMVSCFLFISIAIGGGFLVMYIVLPESPSTSWLPLAGVTLVCLPWLFWFLTFFYRVISRACGFRMVCFGSGSASSGAAAVYDDYDGDDQTAKSPDDRQAVVVMNDDEDISKQNPSTPSSNSSTGSRESEAPLAYSGN